MQAMRAALERLVLSLQWFDGAPEVRLLHALTSSELRLACLEHIAAMEHSDRNRRPFLILETPMLADDDGWGERAEELRSDMEELREMMAEAGRPDAVGPLPSPPQARSGLERFALELQAAVRCLGRPFEGLTIIFSPLAIETPERWASDVRNLVSQPALRSVRWILLDLETPLCKPVSDALGREAEQVDARVDRKALAEEMRAAMAAGATAPEGADVMARLGGAGPAVPPPPRPGAPPKLTPEQRRQAAAEAGIPEAVLDPDAMLPLRAKVMEAGMLAGQGDPIGAVRAQREARDLCRSLGMAKEAVLMELVLGGFLLQANAPDHALASYDAAQREATENGWGQEAVQAKMARAGALLVLKRRPEGIAEFAEAGRLAEDAGLPLLAIECYRTAGQFLVEDRRVDDGARLWRKAIEAAEDAPPELRSASSAPEIARNLAALCRGHGLHAQADSLEEQAKRLETPPTVDEQAEAL